MPALNKVQLIGYLGNKPVTHTTPNGNKVTTFSLAVGRRWRGNAGETKEATDWFNVEAWGRLGDICAAYLDKGRLAFLEGRLQTDKFEQNGSTQYFTKVILRHLQILDRKPKEEDVIVEEEELPPD